jgi:hypothetical protein
MANGGWRTVSGAPAERVFDRHEIDRLCHAHKTNLWIAVDELAAAEIRSGLLCSRLSLTLVGGRRLKLLWLRADPAGGSLREAFVAWGVSV